MFVNCNSISSNLISTSFRRLILSSLISSSSRQIIVSSHHLIVVSSHSLISQSHLTVSSHSLISQSHLTVSSHSLISQSHLTVVLSHSRLDFRSMTFSLSSIRSRKSFDQRWRDENLQLIVQWLCVRNENEISTNLQLYQKSNKVKACRKLLKKSELSTQRFDFFKKKIRDKID